MPKRAGSNIRELAITRKTKAILSFIAAGGIYLFPLMWMKFVKDFTKPLAKLNPQQPPMKLQFPPIFWLFLVGFSLILIANGVYLWKRAAHADQGAKGEEETAQELDQLQSLGWKMEFNLKLSNGLGDADIVCISPRGKAFVIDVKSHKGTIITEGDQLKRRMGKEVYAFEKDFLAQALKQALQVRKQMKLEFVTPIVAFSNATVGLSDNKIKNVYVLEKARLVDFLKAMG